MNKALWTSQRLRGVLFSVTGFGKIPGYEPEVRNRTLPQVAWFSALPRYLLLPGLAVARSSSSVLHRSGRGRHTCTKDRQGE